MTHHASVNESIRLALADALTVPMRSALAAFCRRNGFPHVFTELIGPLLGHSRLVFSFAVSDRPWPPKGVGSETIEAFAVAMIGHEHRAHLTPVVADRRHATNIGLLAAVSRQLLAALKERGVASCGYVVRQGEPALERALERASFARADLNVATEFAEYVEYAAKPADALEALGLERIRLGDLLAGSLKGEELDVLGAYHFTLSTALAPYLLDDMRSAALLAGLIDLVATLPPGGVPPGTPGPELPGHGGRPEVV